VKFNAGLHLLLRSPSQKLWEPKRVFGGRILYAGLALISSKEHKQCPLAEPGYWTRRTVV